MPTRSCCACGVPFRVPTSERAATCYVTSLDPLKIPNVRVTFWVRRILAGERDITHMTVSAGTALRTHRTVHKERRSACAMSLGALLLMLFRNIIEQQGRPERV